jgi:uncharacterized protein YyaL (SSP411 family)
MALTTLRRMCEGGIYDQIGGGFARYSVDERWEIPHFEKMLYDNGPLLGSAPMPGRRAAIRCSPASRETAAWVMREMQAPKAATFRRWTPIPRARKASTTSGTATNWRAPDARRVGAGGTALGLRRPAEFRESPLARARCGHLGCAGEEALLASARQKLFAARERRVRPGCDDKILTSWNALMIEGMAHAARVFGRDDWLHSARRAAEFLRTTMWRDGRLLATARGGRAHLDAYLDDYAFLLAALLEMMQAEFRNDDLEFAIELADSLLARFEDKDAGGFHFTAHDHETLIHRPKSGHDNATPSGNGVAAFALQRLGHLLGETRYLDAAERTLQLFWPQIRQAPGGFASCCGPLEEACVPPEIVILRGPAGDWRTGSGAWARIRAHGAGAAQWNWAACRRAGQAGKRSCQRLGLSRR